MFCAWIFPLGWMRRNIFSFFKIVCCVLRPEWGGVLPRFLFVIVVCMFTASNYLA